MNRKLKIVYMGTPDFAVGPLRAIMNKGYDIKAVVTSADKPAGRGRKLKMSAVKTFALENHLNILQPTNLKDPQFLNELKSIHADVFVVVAFRMLPEVVWKIPSMGTFNLHASLLPQYRGAAPINWAIINGETETGLTTFFINHTIDTGKIILRKKTKIYDDDTAGDLHDRLMLLGEEAVVESLTKIKSAKLDAISQDEFQDVNEKLIPAPKIFKQDCLINWNDKGKNIYNKIRGLSPYPTAYSIFKQAGKDLAIKIYKARFIEQKHNNDNGRIIIEGNKKLLVCVPDGYINILELQLQSKKRMSSGDFLKGFVINSTEGFFIS